MLPNSKARKNARPAVKSGSDLKIRSAAHMTNALAYIREFRFGSSDEILGRDQQKESIRRFAEENRMEIVAWFEDKADVQDVLSRPGIRAMLAYNGAFESILCERIWAISHSMEFLTPFLRELDRRGARLETVAPLWDCVSQQCRRRAKSLSTLPQIISPASISKTGGYHVARPAHLHFVHLVRRDFIPMR